MEMVQPERETLNSLFEELSDWEQQLKHLEIDLKEVIGGLDNE